MVLKPLFATVLLASSVFAGGPSTAATYSPGDFLTLDLSKAAFSPNLLGPPTQFEPVPVEAKSMESGADLTPALTEKTAEAAPARSVRPHLARLHTIARPKLVRRHTNPLDAQASDTRVQVWPCRTGGICNWQR